MFAPHRAYHPHRMHHYPHHGHYHPPHSEGWRDIGFFEVVELGMAVAIFVAMVWLVVSALL